MGVTRRLQLQNGGIYLIDAIDFTKIGLVKWSGYTAQSDLSYARRMEHGEILLMHRVITGAIKGEVVDHINGNGLDNRRSNLRLCTLAQNLYNKKKYKNNTTGDKGIELCKDQTRAKPWRATLTKEGKKVRGGYHETALEAAVAYNTLAIKYYGEFARLNII
jgi:hypothetical protein